MKGEGHQGGVGESCQGLADRGGTGKNVTLLVDKMKLIPTPLSRYARKASFQGWLLERNQLELVFPILPVDPPGEAASEASVAVVDDRGFTILHACRFLLMPLARETFLTVLVHFIRIRGDSKPPA